MAPARPTAAGEQIAVVIPTHNTRDLTLRCLASLEAGSLRPAEVVVVDDGSDDGTAEEIATRYPGVRVLRNSRATGFSAAVNRGLAETSSPVLLMLNSDTEVETEYLAEVARAFAADPGLGIAGATLLNPDGSRQWSGGPVPSLAWLFAASSGLGRVKGKVLPAGYEAPEPRRVDWVAGTALAMRREVWDSCGPLDERFELYCQDLDLCLRAGQAGWEIYFLPDCQVLHHLGATVGRSVAGQQDLAKLWADLVRWAAKSRGEQFASRVARTLRCGGLVRRLGLLVRGLFSRPAERSGLRRAISEVDGALARLRRPGR